jgi:apolipoprotein N-acyltransferase
LTLSAATSGVLLSAAFPPLSWGPLSFIALVPVLYVLGRSEPSPRACFKTGHLFGCAFFGAHLWWVVKLSPAASMTMPWLMGPATILLVLYLALYPALFFFLMRWIGRGRKGLGVLLAPALWALVERLRGSGELAFPWGSIGYSLVGRPDMIQGAAAVGVIGLGALIVLVNALVAIALLARSLKAKVVLVGIGAAVFALNMYAGRRSIEKFDAVEHGDRFDVVLAQPNVDLGVKWNPEFADSTFRLIEKMSREAGAFKPRLIVFPETAAPIHIRYSPAYRKRMADLAQSLDAAIFIGFLDARYDGPKGVLNSYNSSGLFDAKGGLMQYDKQHLLPFGEAMPFAWKFRFLQEIDFGQANFLPGPDRPPIPSPVGKLAPLICFESTLPGLARKAVSRGADVFVNITNDGWFGDTPGPRQHCDMAILRAVENRRFLARCGNTGVTLFADPVGRIIRVLGMDREALLSGKVYRVNLETFYTRYGDRPVLIASLAVALWSLVTGFLARAGRFRPGKRTRKFRL